MESQKSDISAILARRHANSADFWATLDGRIYVGSPFSTLSSLGMLHELGVGPEHEAVQGGLALILNACQEDGRIHVGLKSPRYPCYTAEAARTMCRFGLTGHPALQNTVSYLIDSSHERGGWRCNFTKFGHGPETEYANPGATLYVLDVLRFFPEYLEGVDVVDKAVESLLDHWDIRKPIGPCHYGIGTLFMEVEYPFLRYNLFFYIYVLSHYGRAQGDSRFKAALAMLKSKLDDEERVIIERPHRGLKDLEFCAKGQPSSLATARYHEIQKNVNG